VRRVPGRTPALLVAALAALLALAPSASAAVYPPGFSESEVVTGLNQPTAVAWAPDGRMFIAQKPGFVDVVPAGGSAPQEILDIEDQVNSYWDRGLLGLALDSDFATPGHNFLYIVYVNELAPLMADGDGPMASKVVRYRVAADSSLSERTELLGTQSNSVCPFPSTGTDCMPADSNTHSIGTIRSAPDRTLWIGNGDASSYESAVDPHAYNTYDPTSIAGKLLHVGPDGRGLAGHAFCPMETDLTKVCTKVHAAGFRNPFRFQLMLNDAGTAVDSIAVGDVGWNNLEELDIVPAAPGGKSYGWPCWEGTTKTPYYKDDAGCTAPYTRSHQAPVHEYPHIGTDGGEASRAILGGPEYTGDQFPVAYRGSIFYADYGGAFISRITESGGVWTSHEFTSDPDSDPATDGHGWYGVDLEQGPDDSLYYTAFEQGGPSDGGIWRIEYSDDNQRPVAGIAANPLSGPTPLTVTFHGLPGSTDPDGDPLTYSWDFGDGSADATGETVSHEYADPGPYTVTLTVSDGLKTDTDEVLISAGNPPQPSIEGPASFRAGTPVTLTGSATDAEDADIPEADLNWLVRLIHGSHTHFVGSYAGTDTVQFTPSTDHDADSHYEATLTATDSDDLEGQVTKLIQPETASVHIDSSPTGAPISYGGLDRVAPVDRLAAIGFASTITAGQSFVRDGHTYSFDSWSNGAARSFYLAIPAGGLSLTARYTTPGGTTPPPPAHKGPAIRLQSGIASLLRRGRLAGRVSDSDGVRSVDVGLAQRRGKRCRWWHPRKGLARRAVSCSRVAWMRARVSGGKWSLRLGRKPPAGSYRVALRARDKLGDVTRLTASVKLRRG
jgi:glucose/arabinose dehydrogenase/PKD repeat protein